MVVEEANQESLHRSAANSLLKTIEEPRSEVLMIFFADVVNDVLPTITSRCQKINMLSRQYNQYLSLARPSNFEQFFLSKLNKEDMENSRSSFDRFVQENSSFADAISLVEAIQSLLKDGADLDMALDYFVTKDLHQVENIFGQSGARYAKELVLIVQIAKEQNKHYVSQKALIETFIYAWHRLKKTGTSPLKIQR